MIGDDDPTQYRVLFENRDDGVRYLRVMTYGEACEHSYLYRARVVHLDKLEGNHD